jgi:hypothetical protein
METTLLTSGDASEACIPSGKTTSMLSTWVSCPRPKAAIGGLLDR